MTEKSQFFSALGSIATAGMAIATFWTLFQYQSKERKNDGRELVERILQPLINNLEAIEETIRESLRFSNMPWKDLADNNKFIVFKLNPKIYQAIDDLFIEIKKEIKLKGRDRESLDSIIASRIAEKLSYPPTTISSSDSWQSRFKWSIGGVGCGYSVMEFIFQNWSASDAIEQSKEEVGGDIESISLYFHGKDHTDVTPEKFDEILKNINDDINNDSKLNQYIDNARILYTKVDNLHKTLGELQSRLSSPGLLAHILQWKKNFLKKI